MEELDVEKPRAKGRAKRPWCLAFILIVTVVVIIAVVVPLAVILPRKGHGGKQSTVIFPLYIYPTSNSSWTPLYEAVEANPKLNFLVVVNPNSGPGPSPLPTDEYAVQVEQLRSLSNVRTVGYVRTGYATRNISEVVRDVSTYAGWASNSSSLAMSGIFFDESPYEYAADKVEYMIEINKAVKNASGLQDDRTIIHNPGVIPDSRYTDPNTDITVVFEDSYSAFQSKLASLDALPKNNRTSYSYMIHSVPLVAPIMGTMGNLRKFVDQLSRHAEYLFVTDLDQDYYESFGQSWTNFTDVVPR